MAQRCSLNYVLLTLLLSVASNEILGKRNNNYDEYGLESETICYIGCGPVRSSFFEFDKLFGTRDKKHTLKISSAKSSGIIVKSNHIFDRWSGVISDKCCRYHVKASKGDGLLGVIQKLSFRKKGSQCLDYVQFKRADGNSTKKFCGQIDHGKAKYYSSLESEQTSEEFSLSSDVHVKSDMKGYLETTIFVSKETLLSGEVLDVSIVYTPFKACRETEGNEYKRMKMKDGREICMRQEVICDGYQNCPPSMCLDEANCYGDDVNIIVSDGTGTKVTVGAVTTILLCFIICVMCLWMCKKYKKVCWSSDWMGSPLPCPEGAGRMPGQAPDTSEGTTNAPVPTAPMLEVVESPLGADKDLPPSYESLFPEQRNSPAS